MTADNRPAERPAFQSGKKGEKEKNGEAGGLRGAGDLRGERAGKSDGAGERLCYGAVGEQCAVAEHGPVLPCGDGERYTQQQREERAVPGQREQNQRN